VAALSQQEALALYQNGRKLRAAGIATTVSGIALLVTGVPLIVFGGLSGLCGTEPSNRCDSPSGVLVAGASFVGVGALAVIIGPSLWSQGNKDIAAARASGGIVDLGRGVFVGSAPQGSMGSSFGLRF
jgi:hypothetical protein